MSQPDDQSPLDDFVLHDPLQENRSSHSQENAPPRHVSEPNLGFEDFFPEFQDPFLSHGLVTEPHDLSMLQVWIPEKTRGFKNEGNSCYLNSGLQCLIHSPPFASIFLHPHSAHQSIPGTENLNLECMFCLLRLLTKKVLENTETSRGLRNYTRRIYEKTPQVFDVQNFDISQQQDSSEFLNKLLLVLGTIEKEKTCGQFDRRALRDLLTTSIFQTCSYTVTEKTICTRCGRISRNSEPGFILTLSTARGTTLNDVLNAEKEEQTVDDFVCGGFCSDTGTATRKWSMTRAPNVLIIQLQRTGFSEAGRGGIEDQFACKYGESLDITAILDGGQNSESRARATYELVGVVIFLPRRRPEDRRYNWDDFNGGHYICYVRSTDKKWTRKNDERHASVDISEVLEQNAFLLFYVRQGSHRSFPAQPVLENQQPNFENELVALDEALGLQNNQQPPITSQLPPPQASIPVIPTQNNAQTATRQPSTVGRRTAHLNQAGERAIEYGPAAGQSRGARSGRFYRVEVPVISGRKFFNRGTLVSETIYSTELSAVVELTIPNPESGGQQARSGRANFRSGRGDPRRNYTNAAPQEDGRHNNPADIDEENNDEGNNNQTRNRNGDTGNNTADDNREGREHPSFSVKIRERRGPQGNDDRGNGNNTENTNDYYMRHPSFTINLHRRREPQNGAATRQQN